MVGRAEEEGPLYQHEWSGPYAFHLIVHLQHLMSNEKMNLCFLETVYIFKPMTIFQIGCSCLALFALYLIEPSHIRGIMPRLPLLSLIINSRKDGDLALSTSFVSPKEGN